MDDLTVSENAKDSSKIELTPDVENSSTPKRKTNSRSDLENTAKKSRRNQQEGNSSASQADLNSFTGRKFENYYYTSATSTPF